MTTRGLPFAHAEQTLLRVLSHWPLVAKTKHFNQWLSRLRRLITKLSLYTQACMFFSRRVNTHTVSTGRRKSQAGPSLVARAVRSARQRLVILAKIADVIHMRSLRHSEYPREEVVSILRSV